MPELVVDERRRRIVIEDRESQLSPQEYRLRHHSGCNVERKTLHHTEDSTITVELNIGALCRDSFQYQRQYQQVDWRKQYNTGDLVSHASYLQSSKQAS